MTDHELPPDVAARMAERVAALKAKKERRKADRDSFKPARAYGLEARKRQKLNRRDTPTVADPNERNDQMTHETMMREGNAPAKSVTIIPLEDIEAAAAEVFRYCADCGSRRVELVVPKDKPASWQVSLMHKDSCEFINSLFTQD